MATNKTGFGAALTVGVYTGAELTDVRVSINHEPVDITDLASTWRERAEGLLDWEVTGTKNYATEAFLDLALVATTSVTVAVKQPDTSVLFSGAGFITRGMTNFPGNAASNEEITVVGNGVAPTVPV